MINPEDISMDDYQYDLPAGRIALHPLDRRDSSRLLVFSEGEISETQFDKIDQFLQTGDLLVANQTKVVQARLVFSTSSGARLELFCLEPSDSGMELFSAMQIRGKVEWNCLAGNLRKWKQEEVLFMRPESAGSLEMHARLLSKEEGFVRVEFSWKPSELSFAELLEKLGKVPLPPYLRREAEADDKERYQTVFASLEGSVAAPTAGLHFTDEVLERLTRKGIQQALLTLHVGAGTFKPVSAERLKDHDMHREEIIASIELIGRVAGCKGNLVSVGTTSLRTLESLYWTAVKGMTEGHFNGRVDVDQWYPYGFDPEALPGRRQAFSYLHTEMKEKGISELKGHTRLLIAPGYKVRTADYLLTNFHQPGSTLILLVSACIGAEWKRVYSYAIQNNFRFLSYGDSSLLKISK
jgi:S-adenosylmethionine:tRNA ribosyltransferase-isomerase